MKHSILIATVVGTAAGSGVGLATGSIPATIITSVVVSALVSASEWLHNRLRRWHRDEVTSVPRASDDADERSFDKGILPCCGGTEFFEGPTGGLSFNIKCANPDCGQGWNVALINGVCVMADRI